MWPFRKKSPDPPSVRQLIDRVSELELMVASMNTQLTTLKKQHQTLSGRFYAKFGAESGGTAPSASRYASGADILSAVGYRAGRPMPTIEE